MLAVVFKPTIARPRVRWPALDSRSALFALIVVSTAVRFVWAYWLEASNDEAYNFLYTVHPAWSQFDHPPATMLIERMGLALFGSVSPLALRFGFVLCGAASTVLLALLTTRLFADARAGFFAALALNVTGFFALKAGSFALPDGPLTVFAFATLWALAEAFAQPPRLRPWLVVGACWGCALASKYHAVFLPAGAVAFALTTASARRHLASPGPYLAVALGLLGFLPALLWNAENGWASFAYQGGRAVALGFRPDKLAQYVGEQMAVWFPWMWLALAAVLVRGLRSWRTASDAERHLLAQATVPIAFFLAIAASRGAMAHWGWIGFLPLYPLLGRAASDLSRERPERLRRIAILYSLAAAGLLLAILLYVRSGWFPATPRGPARDFSGWESVGKELRIRGLLDRPNTFLVTDDWHASGHLAFETDGTVPVLCYRSDDARGFAHWSRPEQWIGWDGLYIEKKEGGDPAAQFAPFFRRIDRLPDISMTRGGRAMQAVRVYLCVDQLRPYPFRGHAPSR
ncbi:MAG: glycosyltransferase family 39 protein [Gemmataceae bacterium]|nr:glycosyltransferase family 39 protein [Gemmataceae bacterium]